MLGRKVPAVTFRTRVRDESVGGSNPFRWQDVTSDDYFAGKRVVLFSLRVLSPRPARPTSCRTSKSSPPNSGVSGSTRSTASPSTTPS